MTVDKIISKTEAWELNITGITLLSLEEYSTYKDNIPLLNEHWWLRSHGYSSSLAFAVSPDRDAGTVYCGDDEELVLVSIRPALQISNLSDFEVGDVFKLANKTWTIISNDYALCDGRIGKCAFRKDWEASDANDYEASNVKKFVEKWYQENILSQPA